MKSKIVLMMSLAVVAAGAMGLGGCACDGDFEGNSSRTFSASACKAPEPVVKTEYVTIKEPCATTTSGAINMPDLKLVVERHDVVNVKSDLVVCGPNGPVIVATGTSSTSLLNGQTVSTTGTGNVSSTSTVTPGGTCDSPGVTSPPTAH